jgi:hypothetical protein
MATQAEVNLLRQQLARVTADRDDAVAAYQQMEVLVKQLLDINKKQASQVDRLLDIVDGGRFADRSSAPQGETFH